MPRMPKVATGVALAALAAVVIFGGIPQIARFASYVVPFMAGAYLLVALVVLALNIDEVPGMLVTIVQSALGLEQAAGGVTGGLMAALLNGVKRGLFSNEAGMGSAPNIAACAVPQPHHPSAQGFVQALGVFIDTIVVCTVTALLILLSGVFEPGSGLTGTELTQAALADHIGATGSYFVAIAILFFAFTSIVGNYSYAENALTYLGVAGPTGVMVLRAGVLTMIVWGSVQTVATVFNTADASMGLMATINLVAIVLLSGTVAKLTRDYFEQRRSGRERGAPVPGLDQLDFVVGALSLTALVSPDWFRRVFRPGVLVVVALVEAGVLITQEQDRPEDFRGLFDFEEAFDRNYPWTAG